MIIRRPLILLGLMFACAGCAKFPATGVSGATRLVFEFQVESELKLTNSPYVYIVALRLSDQDVPIGQGPVPVIAPPWGNGFVAGNATHYVLLDPAAAQPLTVYQFLNSSTLQQWFPIGVPVSSRPINPGSNSVRFELDLSQLVTNQAQRDALRTMQVNFLTMDRVPQSGSSKLWDALGDSRNPASINDFVSVSLRSQTTVTNQTSGFLEPNADQADPQLDLVDWRIEVQLR